KQQFKVDEISLESVGPRNGVIALVAAALNDKAISSVTLHGALGSLKDVIEQNRGVEQSPELFCFGLLEQVDVRQLGALVAPRPCTFVKRSERARTELTGMVAWYKLAGREFDPLGK